MFLYMERIHPVKSAGNLAFTMEHTCLSPIRASADQFVSLYIMISRHVVAACLAGGAARPTVICVYEACHGPGRLDRAGPGAFGLPRLGDVHHLLKLKRHRAPLHDTLASLPSREGRLTFPSQCG
jgi:hypothetical protein